MGFFVRAALAAAGFAMAAEGFAAQGRSRSVASLQMGRGPDLGDKYCENLYRTVRRKTRTVECGPVKIGSEHPIALQTMTNTDTKNVMATVDQVMKCHDLGANLVRLTVQGKREAEACMQIRETLFKKGYDVPLVADIHFQPKVAMMVAECFEKIRVNPGNFADGTKSFEETVYETQEEYQGERGHIEELFVPLVEKCKRLNRAMRIGTNHGSLSARVMSFYGDTPEGMVESALEFADICRDNDYHNFLFSMKASNPVVMVQAYRRLAARMYDLDWDYPLHLGVTEAGEGEDGRMKSAIGIGTLLQDGLGDTIRVSLTEDPELELEPCGELARIGTLAASAEAERLFINVPKFEETKRDFADFQRRRGADLVQTDAETFPTDQYLHRDGSVFSVIPARMLDTPDVLYQMMGCKTAMGMPFKDIATADSLVLKDVPSEDNTVARRALKRLQEVGVGVIAPWEALEASPISEAAAMVTLSALAANGAEGYLSKAQAMRLVVVVDGTEPDEAFEALAKLSPSQLLCVFLKADEVASRVHASRRVFERIQQIGSEAQVLHYAVARDGEGVKGRERFVLKAGSEIGALLVDGLGDGVVLENGLGNDDVTYPLAYLRETAFGMLQGTRMRTVKTEFVSCPSCGRTLFDLQEVTDQIRQRTGHLPGVSIAIMGCIVNGPGEMADADFGYVGSAAGKIDLYVGKSVVRRGIKMDTAPDELVDLIKEHGMWKDPEEAEEPVVA